MEETHACCELTVCAIVDANVAHEVFGSNPPPAGEGFFQWISTGRGRLVSGGKALEELERSSGDFRQWASQAVQAGTMTIVSESELEKRTQQVEANGEYQSDDPHVLALAQVSGARLLYSNDSALQGDFKNRRLIDNPRGRVYSTRESKNFTPSRRRLLQRTDLCAGRR